MRVHRLPRPFVFVYNPECWDGGAAPAFEVLLISSAGTLMCAAASLATGSPAELCVSGPLGAERPDDHRSGDGDAYPGILLAAAILGVLWVTRKRRGPRSHRIWRGCVRAAPRGRSRIKREG